MLLVGYFDNGIKSVIFRLSLFQLAVVIISIWINLNVIKMLYSKKVILMMHCPIFSYSISKHNMILINTSLKLIMWFQNIHQLSTTSCDYASESSSVINWYISLGRHFVPQIKIGCWFSSERKPLFCVCEWAAWQYSFNIPRYHKEKYQVVNIEETSKQRKFRESWNYSRVLKLLKTRVLSLFSVTQCYEV